MQLRCRGSTDELRRVRGESHFREGVHPVKNGVILALAGYAVYAWADALIKSLGGQLSVFEIGFFNILFASIFLLIFRPAGERWRDFWRMKRPWAVNARAVLGRHRRRIQRLRLHPHPAG